MNTMIRRVTGTLLSLLLIASVIPARSVKAASSIDDFVTRCYKVAFQREPDEEGFNFWKGRLEKSELVGSTTVFQFIFSQEYINQKTSDKQYVKDLYTMFMGREPDDEGYSYWCGQMKSGLTRQNVFAGFANSDEFYTLCSDAGISAGLFSDAFPLEQINNVNLFVERMYKITLGRLGDKDGQAYWVNGLLSGQLTGTSCAANYIFSDEYSKKDMSVNEYVQNLYLAFMGREADEDGLNYWCDQMSSGMSKAVVFAGFANSSEFQTICQKYGIVFAPYKAPITKGARVRQTAYTETLNYNGITVTNRYVIEYAPNSNTVVRTNHYENNVLVDYEIEEASENLKVYKTFSVDGKLQKVSEFHSGDGYYFNIYRDGDNNVILEESSKCFYTKDDNDVYTYKYYDYNDNFKYYEESKFSDTECWYKTYDTSGKLTNEYNEKSTIENGRRIRDDYSGTTENGYRIYEYYKNGNLSKVTNYFTDGSINSITTYTQDANGRQTSTTERKADGTLIYQSTSTYDEFGNEIQHTAAGEKYNSVYTYEYEAY